MTEENQKFAEKAEGVAGSPEELARDVLFNADSATWHTENELREIILVLAKWLKETNRRKKAAAEKHKARLGRLREQIELELEVSALIGVEEVKRYADGLYAECLQLRIEQLSRDKNAAEAALLAERTARREERRQLESEAHNLAVRLDSSEKALAEAVGMTSYLSMSGQNAIRYAEAQNKVAEARFNALHSFLNLAHASGEPISLDDGKYCVRIPFEFGEKE